MNQYPSSRSVLSRPRGPSIRRIPGKARVPGRNHEKGPPVHLLRRKALRPIRPLPIERGAAILRRVPVRPRRQLEVIPLSELPPVYQGRGRVLQPLSRGTGRGIVLQPLSRGAQQDRLGMASQARGRHPTFSSSRMVHGFPDDRYTPHRASQSIPRGTPMSRDGRLLRSVLDSRTQQTRRTESDPRGIAIRTQDLRYHGEGDHVPRDYVQKRGVPSSVVLSTSQQQAQGRKRQKFTHTEILQKAYGDAVNFVVPMGLHPPWWTYLIMHTQKAKRFKCRTHVGMSRNPFRKHVLHNLKSLKKCKVTRPAAGYWMMCMVVGPFETGREAATVVKQWRSSKRGEYGRHEYGIKLCMESEGSILCFSVLLKEDVPIARLKKLSQEHLTPFKSPPVGNYEVDLVLGKNTTENGNPTKTKTRTTRRRTRRRKRTKSVMESKDV